eukprot:6721915-Pyramimonas_sp.AAC.1
MDFTPFGSSAARPRISAPASYLGLPKGESQPPRGRMTKGQLDALVPGTWGKPLPKFRDRAMALHLAS